jgi:hypothetical protein
MKFFLKKGNDVVLLETLSSPSSPPPPPPACVLSPATIIPLLHKPRPDLLHRCRRTASPSLASLPTSDLQFASHITCIGTPFSLSLSLSLSLLSLCIYRILTSGDRGRRGVNSFPCAMVEKVLLLKS